MFDIKDLITFFYWNGFGVGVALFVGFLIGYFLGRKCL